jgi:two-component system osmolarity sensor histidine kinase EnvZ
MAVEFDGNRRLSVKALLPTSLLGRSLLILVIPLIVLQVVTAIIFFDRHWDKITGRLADSLTGEVALLVAMVEEDSSTLAMAETAGRAGHLRMSIVLRRGAILQNEAAEPPSARFARLFDRSLANRVHRPVRFQVFPEANEIRIWVQLTEGVLEIDTTRERLFSGTTTIFLLWMVGAGLVLFAIATVFMRNQVRPIQRLALAADAFGKGRDSAPFHIAGAREVRQAATAFVRMRERIARQLRQRTDMLTGVSHDMRTPLTRMRLQLAMLSDKETAQGLEADVAEMESMLQSYLDFARGEGGEATRDIDLSVLLEDVVKSFRRGGSSEIRVKAVGTIRLQGRPHALARCLGNLVGNAVRHAEQIVISAERVAGGVEIRIDDNGSGIPADKREIAFRPFLRFDPSRNVDTGGVGLGLAIARDIARGHGGDVMLAESPQGGLRAVLRLPD